MTDATRKYTRRSQKEWQSLINQWQQSDLSAANFCKEYEVSSASFYKWRQRLADNSLDGKALPIPPPDFIDITTLGSSADQPAWNIVLNLGDGLSLTLNRN